MGDHTGQMKQCSQRQTGASSLLAENWNRVARTEFISWNQRSVDATHCPALRQKSENRRGRNQMSLVTTRILSMPGAPGLPVLETWDPNDISAVEQASFVMRDGVIVRQ